MATMGLKYVACAKMIAESATAVPTYAPGLEIGRAVSVNLAITNAEGELYANDQLAEYEKEFSSGALTMEVDNISLENQAMMYGSDFTDGELLNSSDDSAPYMGIGGYQVLRVRGVRKYRAWFLPKAKANVPDWSGTTKGNSISFGTEPMVLKVMAPDFGPWRRVKEFTSEAAAKAYIDQLLGVEARHSINVQKNGAASGDSVTPIGLTSVAAGAAFELVITGTPTALYDNGADSHAAIADGKYVLSNVTADHEIAVIF